MSMDQPEGTAAPETETETTETPPGAAWLAQLPRLPNFRRPSPSPTPAAPSPPPPASAGPSTPETTPLSPASTDQPKPDLDLEPPRTPRPGDADWVDPADLKAAIGQACDIAFVMIGQGFGTLERRAKRLPEVDRKWIPTKKERELVLQPAGRIAKRHITADATVMDTIDGCMIAAGVGSFAMRGYFGIEPLGDDDAT